LGEVNCKVHVLACDNIIIGTKLARIDELLDTADIVVWVASDYANAEKNPGQFTWIEVDSNGKIDRLMVKEASPPVNAKVVIGNFSFKSVNFAKLLIEATLQANRGATSETYLDWVIKQAIDGERQVVAFDVDRFWALGTPDEFLTLQYWADVFPSSKVD